MAVKPVESYEDLLYQIQTYTDENQKTYPQKVEMMPPEHSIFEVDLNTRTINSPQFLSVQYDHNAEVVYFKCARYYENVDLAGTVCMVEYVNADGDAGVYWVPYIDDSHYEVDPDDPSIVTPIILIPWAIEGLATLVAGKIKYTLKFFRLLKETDRETGDSVYTYIYNMSLKPAESEILFGMDLSEEDLEIFKLEQDVVTQIYYDLSFVQEYATTYWVDV